ncbi:uncharacterized protein BDV14DRAFT_168214 [Aspergillus stella-maris]|uniref:uncharacterized protein n=1 Tax=Aspergillus stella-maris TaxID=1810926 RepID=UPI003CCCAF6E
MPLNLTPLACDVLLISCIQSTSTEQKEKNHTPALLVQDHLPVPWESGLWGLGGPGTVVTDTVHRGLDQQSVGARRGRLVRFQGSKLRLRTKVFITLQRTSDRQKNPFSFLSIGNGHGTSRMSVDARRVKSAANQQRVRGPAKLKFLLDSRS